MILVKTTAFVSMLEFLTTFHVQYLCIYMPRLSMCIACYTATAPDVADVDTADVDALAVSE